MNASFDNCSLIKNIIIQKDRQEESSIKESKKKKNTQQTESDFINGIQNQKYIKTNKIEIEKTHFQKQFWPKINLSFGIY
jgi:hypothetical protein